MGKQFRNIVIVLVILIVLWLINRGVQTQYETAPEAIFSGQTDEITRVDVAKLTDTLSLVKEDTWTIAGHDSLVLKETRLNDLFDIVLGVNRETLVSENPDKWTLYSVDDSTGTKLSIYDGNGNTLGSWYFGRSMTDWARNYVRDVGENAVYLTDANVLYRLNTKPTYWGEKPKPPTDTTATDSLPQMTIPAMTPQ